MDESFSLPGVSALRVNERSHHGWLQLHSVFTPAPPLPRTRFFSNAKAAAAVRAPGAAAVARSNKRYYEHGVTVSLLRIRSCTHGLSYTTKIRSSCTPRVQQQK